MRTRNGKRLLTQDDFTPAHREGLRRKVQHHAWLGEDAKAISRLLGKCTSRIHQLRKIDLSKYPE